MKALILVLFLAGCATQEPLTKLCVYQSLGFNEAGLPVIRMHCEAEGTKI